MKLVSDCGWCAIGNFVAPASPSYQKADNERAEYEPKDLDDTIKRPHNDFPVQMIIGRRRLIGVVKVIEAISDLVDFVVARMLDQLGVEQTLVKRWEGENWR